VPFVGIWDDHDFGGNNSNRKASSHEAARLTYEEYVPHYPLASGEGDVPIYQSFAVGRVKFILTDLRSERDDAKKKDNAGKSMMGARQKEWFKKELLEANGKYPLICWVSSSPDQPGRNKCLPRHKTTGFIHHTNLVESVTSRTNRNRAPLMKMTGVSSALNGARSPISSRRTTSAAFAPSWRFAHAGGRRWHAQRLRNGGAAPGDVRGPLNRSRPSKPA
jgi:hypothetical protein